MCSTGLLVYAIQIMLQFTLGLGQGASPTFPTCKPMVALQLHRALICPYDILK